ncbi:MAG: amidohydrolase family protein [Gammaproteobacteria bacterium]|nr:amidohydrolase family protein [Gammaproteobacteria bacterium]
MKLFDAHFHIVDKRFPVVANDGYLPEEFTVTDYLNRMSGWSRCGGAVVSGSFQAFDQSYLVDTLKKLGPSFVGVTQLPNSVSDNELHSLNKSGVRAVRFNLKRGGSEELRHLDSMARRVHEFAGWHVELYVDSKELDDIYKTLVALPAISIDHLGLTKDGFSTLVKLAEKGIRVKASGFGRVDFDVITALYELYSANPQSVMFGTDLPSTRSPRSFSTRDIQLIFDSFEPEQVNKILYKNALEFYLQTVER